MRDMIWRTRARLNDCLFRLVESLNPDFCVIPKLFNGRAVIYTDRSTIDLDLSRPIGHRILSIRSN